jgi:hypothetical protein
VRQKKEFMKIGFVRVTNQEQHEALQIDALKEAGCEKWFLDEITGSKADTPGSVQGPGVSAARRQTHLPFDGCAGRI